MYIFGIDIGGTAVKLGFFRDDGVLLDHWEIPTHPEQLLEDISQTIQEYLNQCHISFEEIFGYGIGIPGIVKNGIAVSCVNLGWKQLDVKKEFIRALGHDAKVYVFNDANIAAFGEAAQLDGVYDSVVFVTLGTGVGGGIILNNEIVEGSEGLCGEIGHISIDETYNFKCGCGNVGCLETISSATGILHLTQFYKNQYATSLSLDNDLTAKDVMDAAKRADPLASVVVDEACRVLAKALASIAVLLNPNAFIIGGGLSNAGAFLLEKIQTYYKKACIQQAKDTQIQLAKLKNNAGIYGACTYLIKKKHEVEGNGTC